MSILSGLRTESSILISAAASRLRPIALLVALGVALSLVAPAGLPSARAESDPCIPVGTLWHFQNYTVSGKTLKLEGYSGPDGTGTLMVTCELYVRKAEMSGWKSRGGEVWVPNDVQSVKVTSWSDGGGDPVSFGPLDNSENACFRIIYNDYKTSWELKLRTRGEKCDTN